MLSHLEAGMVVKRHDADTSCELCKTRINRQTNGQTNGRMEYRIS